MSELGEHAVTWPSNALSEVPFRVYTDPEQYALEQEHDLQGANLELSVPRGGDPQSRRLGRHHGRRGRGHRHARRRRRDQRLRQPLRPSRQPAVPDAAGNGKEITCIYHGWSYDLAGQLTGVAFEKGVKRQGGMPPEFRKEEHHLRGCGSPNCAAWCSARSATRCAGPRNLSGRRRGRRHRAACSNRPAHIIGRSTQVLPNNWKLYFENVKDTYHASILHTFLTTFRINRLSQPGGINIDDNGGNHFSLAKLDYAAEDADYKAAALRADSEFRLADNSIVESVDEYGDQVSVQILTVFPAHGAAADPQHHRGAGDPAARRRRTELEWIHLGFDDDDEAMTERRLRQGNLVGAAGYISMEDGCVGGFVQRALRYNDDGSGIVMMGGHDAESQNFRASEAAIRGFWKQYRALMGD